MDFIRDAFAGALSALNDVAGETITYNDSVTTPMPTMKGLISGRSTSVGGGNGVGISSRALNITVAIADLPAAVQADVLARKSSALRSHIITARNAEWNVTTAEPDDEGGVVFRLKRA